ncbi:MAG: SprB repeat-containing protein [Saprospiraceae bacterium]
MRCECFGRFTETQIDGACPNSYTLVRTWMATDNCGNTASGKQTISVGDTTPPVFTSTAADVTVECSDIPGVGSVTATDNCDNNVTVTFSEVTTPGICTDSYVITRTWIAIDNCDNANTLVQKITVEDNTPPVLIGVPADVTADCDGNGTPPIATVTATDNCDADVEVTFAETEVNGGCAGSFVITRTWTATDNCGNTASAQQTISIGDATPPVLVGVPANVTVECDAVPTVAVVTAEDACDPDVDVQFTETTQPGTCEHSYTLIRSWSAEDECGNVASATQTIKVVDSTPPVLVGVPEDVTGECNDDGMPPPVANVTATDNCDTDVTITLSEVMVDGPCEGTYVLTRIWTATDACGNSVSDEQVITAVDETAPALGTIPADVTVECDAIPTPETVTAYDLCAGTLTAVLSEQVVPGACEDSYTLIRTWTAEDPCGNSSSDAQIIVVRDTKPPVFGPVPKDITLDCDGGPVPPANTVTATDNCDADVTVNLVEIETPGLCDGAYTITRTWTAVDNCGNTSTKVQHIYVGDATAPDLVGVPVDVTVECNAVPTPANVTADDACDDDVDVVFSEQIIPGTCPDAFTIIRTWSAEDDCGNATSASQTIVVEDTTAPVLVGVPADVTVDCDGNNVPPVATVTATDNCDVNVTVTFSESEVAGGCTGSFVITRVWTATDNCGNTATGVQTISVGDAIPPVLVGVPGDATVECDNVPDPAIVTADDACDDDVEVIFNETIQDGPCEDSYTLIRTWIAEDECGNSTSASQTVVVEDTTAPVLVGIPVDMTGECNDDGMPPPVANVSATDNCDSDVEITLTETYVDGPCEGTYVLTRLWTATDNCGNTATGQHTITAVDGLPPALGAVPADLTIQCDEAIPTPANVFAEDLCAGDVVAVLSEEIVPGTCEDSYTLIRTWTATDPCGNSSSESQLITIVDTKAPVLGPVPKDVTLDCDGGDIPPANPVTATDNCDQDVDVTFTETEVPGNCAGAYTVTRTWVATDNCGNTSSKVQHIYVGDATAPEILGVPADITLECSTDDPPLPTVTVEDLCDPNPTLSLSEETIQGNCPGNYTLVRTWTAEDACGNTATAAYSILIGDHTAPEFDGDLPEDMTIECDADVPAAVNLTALDNCDPDIDVLFDEVITPGICPQSYTITRTWEAEDDCGNQVKHVQVIYVEDTTAPIIDGVPADVTINLLLGEVIPGIPMDVEATDNCDDQVIPTFEEEVIDGSCGYQIVRTWVAEDECGNLAIQSQTITVVEGLEIELDVIHKTCDSLGSISVNVISGQTPIIYTWADLPGVTDADVRNDLEAGSYSLTVTDANGCSAVFEQILVKDECNCIYPEVDTILISQPTCAGGDGSIEILLVNDLADYTFMWSPNVSTTNSADGLNAGEYEVRIVFKDNPDCFIKLTIMLTIPDAPEAEIVNKTPETCAGKDGSATLSPVEYLYTWPDGFTGSFRDDLTAGTYTVQVLDTATNCVADIIVTIGKEDGIEVDVVSTTAETCVGANGSAVLSPAIYDYLWSDGGTGATRDDLSAGTYVVTATDSKTGCSATLDLVIELENTLVASAVIVQQPDCQTENGSVTITVTGGSGTYSFSWGGGATKDDLGSGDYTVTVTDQVSLCQTVVHFTLLDNTAGLTIIADTLISLTCSDSENGSLTYQLVPAPGFSMPANVVFVDASGTQVENGSLTAGNYCLRVFDANNCFAGEHCFTVEAPAPIEASVTITPQGCDTLGTITLDISGGTDPYTVDWAHLPGSNNVQNLVDLSAGLYSCVITDANGCTVALNALVVEDICNPCPPSLIH